MKEEKGIGFAGMTVLRSSHEHGIMNQFRCWAKLCAGLMTLVLVGLAAMSSTAYAASPATKPNLDGYTGSDARYIIDRLPEPAIKPGYKFKVGFLQCFAGLSVLYAIQTEAEKKVKAMGGEFIAYDSSLDIQKQASQMEQLISQKVDLIIAFPLTDLGLTQGVAEAKKAGIPVVMISAPSSSENPVDPNATAMVGMAYDQYSYATMKYVAKKYPQGKVAILGYGLPAEALDVLMGSAKHYGKEMGLNILGQVNAQGPGPNPAMIATQAIMGKYPNTQVIVAYNDYSAMGAVMALKSAGATGVVAATPNGGSEITVSGQKSGAVLAAYRCPWEKIGETAAIAAYDILTKQNLPQKRMLLMGELATKENVNSISFVH